MADNPLVLLQYPRGIADQQRIGEMGNLLVLVGIGERMQEMPHAIQAGPFFVIGFDHCPRRIGSVGVEKHRLFGFSVIVPAV